MSTAQALAEARTVLARVANDSPQQQANAIRAWWLDHLTAEGSPPVPFAVLALVLDDEAFTIAFQAHFDAATTS